MKKNKFEAATETFLKIHRALDTSRHPDKMAAMWAMANFSNAMGRSFPDRKKFNTRLEGNVFIALCFRNGPIEDVHDDGKLGDREMKAINIWSSRAMTGVLALKEIFLSIGPEGKDFWEQAIVSYHAVFCANWETTHEPPTEEMQI